MPSPKRKTESDSKIAYTRWEPLVASASVAEAENDLETASTFHHNNNSIPFHHFEEEANGGTISIIHHSRNRSHKSKWRDLNR